MPDAQHLIINGRLTPDQTLTYVHVPFTVPEDIERIDVAYSYDAAISSDPLVSGGNTIDIGIFDPRGVDFLKAGYRGWSGSARRKFSVGRTTATPGYMPGTIFAGTWNICLGAYKVAPQGCNYQLDIRLIPAIEGADPGLPARLPLDDSKTLPIKPDGWYFGELHCHTINSDGDSTSAEIVALAEALGLDFLAIMDHNNLTHQVDLNGLQSQTRLLLIPGYEVTTYYGHWNIWGDGAWVDFRVQQPADLDRAIAFAREQGYLVSCNHPRPFGPDWAFPQVTGYDCVEVWNGPWELLNPLCLAFWEAHLQRGERLVAVGGSDHHFSHQAHEHQLGTPTVAVYIAPDQRPTARRLRDALRAGHCFITERPTGPRLTLRSGAAIMGDSLPLTERLVLEIDVQHGAGTTLQILGTHGEIRTLAIEQDSVQLALDIALAGSSYIRAQLSDPASGHLRALTNPLYFDRHEHR
ncbi:MAG: PHP domain-containing protein [Chloroflexi bacterium]|uniref:CehA/McbA family metallohydrolase n=1 Tax=Candidatus Flexifilum breve TaxID=3140694 RepID=UPI003136EFF7|nr:PHP domain-containing protein [Chloroflexota bacterium]